MSKLVTKFASVSQRVPAEISKVPFPFFGSFSRATNFAEHHFKSLPRFSSWLLSAPFLLAYAAWPAVVHNVDEDTKVQYSIPDPEPTAASSAPIPMAERVHAKTTTLPFHVQALSDEAEIAVAKAHLQHKHDDKKWTDSVDALRRFATRPGVKYEWQLVENDDMMDLMPIPPGMKKHPYADEDEDEDEEEEEEEEGEDDQAKGEAEDDNQEEEQAKEESEEEVKEDEEDDEEDEQAA